MLLFLELCPVLLAVCCLVLAFLPERHRGIVSPVFAEGEIISQVTQRFYRHHNEIVMLAPVVRYQTAQGEQTATIRQFVPEWQYRWKQGDRVTICYSQSCPGVCELCRDSRVQWRRIVLCTIGAGTLLAYLILRVQYADMLF